MGSNRDIARSVVLAVALASVIFGAFFGSSCSRAPDMLVGLTDQSVAALDWGNITFNTPATMKYEQPHLVELLLSPTLSVEELQAQLQENDSAEAARIRISNRMEAMLTGTGFTIQAQTPLVQAVTSQQVTSWTWEVTPKGGGRQSLHMAVSAHVDLAGHDAPLVVQTFAREIVVDITIQQRVSGFVSSNWQWLWAVVVAPIAGYLWKSRKKRKARSKKDPD